MELFIGICTGVFGLSCGFNLSRVLRMYLPGYQGATALRKISYAVPITVAYTMLISLLAQQLRDWSGNAQASYLLALMAGVAVLLWLRDQHPELDHE